MSLKVLLHLRWILPRPGASGRRLIEQSFRELAIKPSASLVETGDLAVPRGLLTAIPPHQRHCEITSGDLVEIPVALGKTIRQIGITSRQGVMLSPAALAVLDEIRSVSALMREWRREEGLVGDGR